MSHPDLAWGVGSNGVWRLVSSTLGIQGGREGVMRFAENANCPAFLGTGSAGAPSDAYFREVLVGDGMLTGGAPTITDLDGETRIYYGMNDGIGMATLDGGQVVPYAGNPILTPGAVGYAGLQVINDPAVTRRAGKV